MTTPIARSDLMWGKWLAVAIIASASVLLQLIGLFVAIRFLAAGVLSPPSVSLVGWILFVVTILLFAIFVVAVEMAVAMGLDQSKRLDLHWALWLSYSLALHYLHSS